MTVSTQVVVRLIGGLGNQLFQIQRGLNFVQAHGGTLVMDDSFLAKSKKSHEVVAMPAFVASYPLIRLGWADLKVRRSFERLFFKLGRPVPVALRPIFLFESGSTPTSWGGRCIIDGFWQDKKYLNEKFLQQVRGLLQASKQTVQATAPKGNLVCVHVRRGDYLTNRHWFRRQQVVLSENYYQDGMAWHRSRDPSCKFHLYTDDEDWAQAHFAGVDDVTVVKSSQLKPVDLLAAMAGYRHFIIANSSLSWWAAVLCEQAGRTVVAPKMWGKAKPADPYILSGWHAI